MSRNEEDEEVPIKVQHSAYVIQTLVSGLFLVLNFQHSIVSAVPVFWSRGYRWSFYPCETRRFQAVPTDRLVVS